MVVVVCCGGCPLCVLVCVWGGGMLSGVLGQCALVAWPAFSAPLCLLEGWGVGVGGLVVNCIVDASILL